MFVKVKYVFYFWTYFCIPVQGVVEWCDDEREAALLTQTG